MGASNVSVKRTDIEGKLSVSCFSLSKSNQIKSKQVVLSSIKRGVVAQLVLSFIEVYLLLILTALDSDSTKVVLSNCRFYVRQRKKKYAFKVQISFSYRIKPTFEVCTAWI